MFLREELVVERGRRGEAERIGEGMEDGRRDERGEGGKIPS